MSIRGDAARSVRYMAPLDGLRGLAVAAVLLFHGGHLVGGYLGVDLFFVLSGFLITTLLLSEAAGTGNVAIGAFWARRARRLLPALFLMIVLVVLYAGFVASTAELHRIRYDAIATLAYVANWREVFSHVDYWSLFSSPSPLQHTWSLAIEEQFYVVWPLVLAAAVWSTRKAARHGSVARDPHTAVARRIFWLAALLAAGSTLLGAALVAHDGLSRVFYGTDTRAVAILVGASLAALLAARGPARTIHGRRVLEVGGLAGAVLLGGAWSTMSGSSAFLFRGGLVICSLAGAAVIAAAAHPREGPLARALRLRPLVLLGVISYGVYLWHWPIFVWLDAQRTGFGGWRLFALQVATTLVTASASFLLVERPIRRGALRVRHLRVLTPAVVAGLVAALFVTTASPGPQEGTAAGSEARAAVILGSRRAPGVGPRLLVVGNSVAYFLARDGLARLHTDPPLTVLNGALPDCNFPDSTQLLTESRSPAVVGSVPCTTAWARDVDVSRPQVVLFTEAGALGELHHGGRWLTPCSGPYDTWLATSLREAAAVLTRYGARLVIATSAYPQFLGEPRSLRAQTGCINAVEAAFARQDPRVSLVDLAHYVCPRSNYCRQRIDGEPMRIDGIHFEGGAALAIATWMLPRIGLPGAGRSPLISTGR